MKKVGAAIIQAAALLALACVVGFVYNALSGSGINPFKRPPRAPVADSTSTAQSAPIKIVTLDEARRFVESRAIVIDARMKNQYDEGHIPGAILLDYYDLGRYLDEVLPLLSKDQEIMVYCEGASCEASQLLAEELYALGFTRLLLFKGGIEEWMAAGMPIEKGAP